MKKSMNSLEVFTTENGEIVIGTTVMDEGYGCDDSIAITPDQVPLLIKWLRIAEKEIRGAKNGADQR